MESYRIKEDVPMPQFSVSLDKVVEKLRLEVVYTPTELKNIPIYTADVNRPGLLLTGYDEYFDPTRIQIFGNAEVGYLTTKANAAAISTRCSRQSRLRLS